MIEGFTMKRFIIIIFLILIPLGSYFIYYNAKSSSLMSVKESIFNSYLTSKSDIENIRSSQDILLKFAEEIKLKMKSMSFQAHDNMKNIKEIQTNQESLLKIINSKQTDLTGQKVFGDKYDLDLTESQLLDMNIEEETIVMKSPAEQDLHDKWIVVTSIFYPTRDVKSLAAIEGWKLVVVGDTKTPKDWRLNGVVYISVDAQKKLGYETVDLLKYRAYTRKNIGYLYAIQHGAKYIYDTDDDNVPNTGKIEFDDMTKKKEYLVYNSNRTFHNVFAHFGQSTLWPRGYPLSYIGDLPIRTYRKCSNTEPYVQQGVVNGDPDLDAIQRLTRKDSNVKFNIKFDEKQEPVVLPHNSFSPFNSQNTFHTYNAFWGLLLPQTTAFRVTDIWRSYITQRLLWDVGGHLAYFGPNAYQDRTGHDYLLDYLDEDALYSECLPLTNFLLQWKGKGKSILARYFELIKDLYKQKILKARDVHIAKAWVRDLISFGYKAPDISQAKIKCSEEIFQVYPEEQPSSFPRTGLNYVNVNSAEKKP